MTGKYTRSYVVPGVLALLVVLTVGWTLRAFYTLVPEMIVGLNGGYYPVQVRSLIQKGVLAFNDFPLLFYVQAGIARLLALTVPLNQAVFFATRLSDTIIPVLLAIPVFLFVHTFNRSKRSGLFVAGIIMLVGLIAVNNVMILHMAGDFQKNAAGLPLFLMYAYCAYRFLEDRSRRWAISAGVFFCLACMTHIGVAALTICFTILLMLAGLFLGIERKRIVVGMAVIGIVLAMSLGVLYAYDSRRVIRLCSIVFTPGKLFGHPHMHHSGGPGGPGGTDNSRIPGGPAGSGSRVRPAGPGSLDGSGDPGNFAGPSGSGGFGDPGGRSAPGNPVGVTGPWKPGGRMMHVMFPLLVISNIVGILGVIIVVAFRTSMNKPTKALLWAASLTVLVFSSPLFNFDYSNRLTLMAFVPGLVPIAYLGIRWRWSWIMLLPATCIIMVVSVMSVKQGPRMMFKPAAYQELTEYTETLPAGNTMILARHGLEWWTAWALNVKVSSKLSAVMESWDEYDTVLYIEETGKESFERNTPSRPGPSGRFRGQPPGMRKRDSFQPDNPPLFDGDQREITAPMRSGRRFGGGPFGVTHGLMNPGELDTCLSTVGEGEYFRVSRFTRKPAITEMDKEGEQKSNDDNNPLPITSSHFH
jgi:hypothetical protein